MNRLYKLLPAIFIIYSGNILLYQDGVLDILLPGDEYSVSALPAGAEGMWMVLHRPMGETSVNLLNVDVKAVRGCSDLPNESSNKFSGRSVKIPQAVNLIMLVRGIPSLKQGAVPTVFLPTGSSGEKKKVMTNWKGEDLTLSHIAELPSGNQPGRYRIELQIGEEQLQLHEDRWHGNGWPDILLDASYKYSVYSTRLYLTCFENEKLTIKKNAVFSRSAC